MRKRTVGTVAVTGIAAILVALGVAPGMAYAAGATVRIHDKQTLVIHDFDGQHNDMLVTVSGGVVTVDDDVSLTPGTDCQHAGSDQTKVTCAAADVDFLFAFLEAGDDTLINQTGWRSEIRGGDGADVLVGSDDSDVLVGGPGPDIVIGGPGTDTMSYDDGYGAWDGVTADLDGESYDDGRPWESDTIWPDVENLTGGPGNDTLTGNGGPNILSGGPGGNDTLRGGGGDDQLFGHTHNDTLSGGPGSDRMWGGSGDEDRISYEEYTVGVFADLDGDRDDGIPSTLTTKPELDQIMADVEFLVGGAGDDTLTGSDGFNWIEGGPGDDTLYGKGGWLDHLDGGPGDDELNGMDGADRLVGGPGADVMSGGAGDDNVTYGWYGSTRTADLVVDADGEPGDDGEQGEGDTVGADVEQLTGGQGDDVLIGNVADNTLFGGSGDDRLYGLAGDDKLYGEGGRDELYGGRDGHDVCEDPNDAGTVWNDCEVQIGPF